MASTSVSERERAMASTAVSVFDEGKHKVKLMNVENKSTKNLSSPPPKPLQIATPEEEGEYPVVVFLHGFLLHNNYYSLLFRHVATYGFIVVGPQLLPWEGDELTNAAATIDWLSEGLQAVLPDLVRANLLKLALAGHSRGGKTAFTLALGKYIETSLEFKVLIGIDPVAGPSENEQLTPAILTYVPQSFNIKMPILVVGAGLGEEKKLIFPGWVGEKILIIPPGAPNGVNHKEFFRESRPPVFYCVAKDYGHLDMLDDIPDFWDGIKSGNWGGIIPGLWSGIISGMCKNGESREPMRRFVGGIIVAFLKAYLESDSEYLSAIVDQPDIAPVTLDPVEFIKN